MRCFCSTVHTFKSSKKYWGLQVVVARKYGKSSMVARIRADRADTGQRGIVGFQADIPYVPRPR
jgi:hypothetical protein